MRSRAEAWCSRVLVAVVLGSGACAQMKMGPKGPSLKEGAYAHYLNQGQRAQVVYDRASLTGLPVLPVMAWGAEYKDDIVLQSRECSWNLHEYSRMETADGDLWLAKDATECSLQQRIVTRATELEYWMPEVDIPRWIQSDMEVVDDSTSRDLSLRVSYTNFNDEPVTVGYQGPRPWQELPKRNGSTMGHSRDTAMALLDVEQRANADHAQLVIDGDEHGIVKLPLPNLPRMSMVLRQVQGGLATGSYRIGAPSTQSEACDPGRDALQTTHMLNVNRQDTKVCQGWTIEPADWASASPGTTVEVVQHNEKLRTLIHRFRVGEDGALELVEMEARSFDPSREEPFTRIEFSPPLPDLRRRFTARADSPWTDEEGWTKSHFVIDMNGEAGFGHGTVRLRWDDDQPVARMRVDAAEPAWIADRPLESVMTYAPDGTVDVAVQRRDAKRYMPYRAPCRSTCRQLESEMRSR